MSGTGTGSRTSGQGLVGLAESIRALSEVSEGATRLFTKREAAKRLGVSARRLRQMLFLGQLIRVRRGRREMVFL